MSSLFFQSVLGYHHGLDPDSNHIACYAPECMSDLKRSKEKEARDSCLAEVLPLMDLAPIIDYPKHQSQIMGMYWACIVSTGYICAQPQNFGSGFWKGRQNHLQNHLAVRLILEMHLCEFCISDVWGKQWFCDNQWKSYLQQGALLGASVAIMISKPKRWKSFATWHFPW